MKKNFKQIPLIILIFCIIIAFYYYIGCPIRLFTGLPCPGCGMTRAVYYLLIGNVNESINCHPLVFTMPLILIIIIFHNKFSKASLITFLVTFSVLFVACYIYRLCTPTDQIVAYRPDLTIYHKLSHFINSNILN